MREHGIAKAVKFRIYLLLFEADLEIINSRKAIEFATKPPLING
jgi:hypothetical protein